jgi:hypothetical protein
MWWANLPFTIRIMNMPSSLLSAFMKKLTALWKNENVHSHLLSTFMMEGAISNGFGNKCLKTSKAHKK